MPIKAMIVFILLGSYTPGPNNIMSMESVRRSGFKQSLPFMLGMASGFTIIMFIAAIFNVILEKTLPSVQPILGAFGALYMLYLAAKPFLPSGKSNKKSVEAPSYIVGLALQFLNPKVFFVSISLMSGFVVPWVHSLPLLAVISLAVGCMGFTSLLLWGFFGSLFQRYFSRYETAVNVIMAILLIYCAWTISGLDLSILKLCLP